MNLIINLFLNFIRFVVQGVVSKEIAEVNSGGMYTFAFTEWLICSPFLISYIGTDRFAHLVLGIYLGIGVEANHLNITIILPTKCNKSFTILSRHFRDVSVYNTIHGVP